MWDHGKLQHSLLIISLQHSSNFSRMMYSNVLSTPCNALVAKASARQLESYSLPPHDGV